MNITFAGYSVTFGGKISDLAEKRARASERAKQRNAWAKQERETKSEETKIRPLLPQIMALLEKTIFTHGKSRITGWDLVDELMTGNQSHAPHWSDVFDKPGIKKAEKAKIGTFFRKLEKTGVLKHDTWTVSTNSDGYDYDEGRYSFKDIGRYRFERRDRTVADTEAYSENRGYKRLIRTGRGWEWKLPPKVPSTGKED